MAGKSGASCRLLVYWHEDTGSPSAQIAGYKHNAETIRDGWMFGKWQGSGGGAMGFAEVNNFDQMAGLRSYDSSLMDYAATQHNDGLIWKEMLVLGLRIECNAWLNR